MNPSYSSDWSREEKEEYATKRMNEMKLKNEKFKQRHAEVEKDRLEAEKKCSAVTSATKILPKTPDSIEEKPTFQREPRKQREWDIGKSSNDGDWYPPAQQDYHPSQEHDSRTWHNESDRHPPAQQDYHRSQDYHHSRPPRGFYDKRRGRQGSFRGPLRGSARGPLRGGSRGPQRGGPRGPQRGYLRGNSSYQGSNQSRSAAFQSGNMSNYSREDNKNNFKTSTETSFKNSSNWNDSKRNSYYSSNAYPKLATKSDSDKMWHDDGLNEVQNKQSRVEKWVKSINKVEDWGEGDEKPCKNYNSVGTGRSSENYQDREQKAWDNEGHADSITKKHFTHKVKYEKQYEHSYTKNVSPYGEKIPHTSDLDHHTYVGKKTSSYGHKRDNKLKYNHGVSSYDNTEVSNFKNDPKVRKQSHYSKNRDSGADIWDDENIDESNNKFSDSKTEFDVSKHSRPDKNRDSKSAAWHYKDADNFDSKTGSEIRKKEYSRKKETESDIWNDCDQTNKWGGKHDTKSGSETKDQDYGEDKDGIWDYNHGDDWNNKINDSEIDPNVEAHNSCKNTDSKSTGWDQENKVNLEAESQTKEHAYCDISNVLDDKVLTSDKNDHEENEEYEENVYTDTKEMGILTQGLSNLQIDSEYETNDSNEAICNESRDSEFIISNNEIVDNSKYDLATSKANFTEFCDDKSKDSDSVKQNFKISEYSDSELNDSKAEVEEQEHDCNTDTNELGFTIVDDKNIDELKEGNDPKSELTMEQAPYLSTVEDSPSSKFALLSDSQAEISADNSSASNQSVSYESNKMNSQNNCCVEMDEKVVLKVESNISCVTDELSTLNSDNSEANSKLNESNELLQQSICNEENPNSQYEVSSENVSCDIINKSSPVLSQESLQDDDLSPHTDLDVTESTKR